MKRFLGFMALVALTGCHALFPKQDQPNQADPNSICRAGSTWAIYANHMSDQVKVLTGEINGDDGITESVVLCTQDIFCRNGGIANTSGAFCGPTTSCTAPISRTGILPDGTVINFNGTTVEIDLAQSKGYAIGEITIDATCHG